MSKIGDRNTLFNMVAKEYKINRALYPGSHIDISPSLFIPDVTYIDNYKGTIQFFKKIREIETYLNNNKNYHEKCNIVFYGRDYRDEIIMDQVDMIISQYAGFVGQATKQYLKEDGILLCNDSHGDATLAYLDEEYILITVIDEKNTLSTKNLDKYFTLKSKSYIDEKTVRTTMKGPKYDVQATNYIFRLKRKVE